jgi:hypothetical protein
MRASSLTSWSTICVVLLAGVHSGAAADDSRGGLNVRLGLGAAFASVSYVLRPAEAIQDSEDRWSQGSLSAAGRFGSRFSSKLELSLGWEYFSVYQDGYSDRFLLLGPELAYYVEEEAPCVYALGGAGLFMCRNHVEGWSDESVFGPGVVVGLGYDFTSNLGVEAALVWGSPKAQGVGVYTGEHGEIRSVWRDRNAIATRVAVTLVLGQ